MSPTAVVYSMNYVMTTTVSGKLQRDSVGHNWAATEQNLNLKRELKQCCRLLSELNESVHGSMP